MRDRDKENRYKNPNNRNGGKENTEHAKQKQTKKEKPHKINNKTKQKANLQAENECALSY